MRRIITNALLNLLLSISRLECHGFICETSEDAIVIAATLYRALMAHMSRSSAADKEKLRKPRNRNGISCVSIASSSCLPQRSEIIRNAPSIKEERPLVPVRPPRKKRSAASSLSGDSSCRG